MQVYDLASIGGPAAMLPPPIEVYTEKEARFLPPRVHVENNTYVIYSPKTKAESERPLPALLHVEDCVSLCQRVLGLKIQEIAKLLDISRASLDLHRKGKVKNMEPYFKLACFVNHIEESFSGDICKAMRSVLIERKTLVQHLLANKDSLEKMIPYFEKASDKLDSITLRKVKIDANLAATRLAGIGQVG
ncbi:MULTISPECIES: hypothetical protein [unclassified Pseudoalteromonas]|uniref:hypothetical protein n=1 Tax=unclassified Pseudoalteromonas TaxID=194690 RepID=UPI001BA48C29|nr:hypothetical protein [Pseudoalteromonas sp. M8]QUI69578.1 hypothetical protein GSF13_07165 [Pseudoalteromonas sp. M8]